MRKTLALIIMAVFLVSLLPAAFAQENTRERGKDVAKERIDARQDAPKDLTEKREERQQVRTAVKERIAEHKKAFADFRATLKACRGQKTPECEAARKDVRNQAKLYLKDTVQDTLDNLKKLREAVASAPTVDQTATQNIDTAIQTVEQTQQEVAALPDDASADQLKKATRDVQDSVKKARHALKVQNARKANAGINGAIVRAEKLEKKLEKTLERLKAKGADTSAADTKVTEFKKHVALARENADKAKAKFEEARTNKENFESLVREGHTFLVEARKHLREAHTALKEAVRAIKGVKDGAETLNQEVAQPDTSAPTATASTTPAPTTTSEGATSSESTTPASTTPSTDTLPTGAVVVPASEGVIDITSA